MQFKAGKTLARTTSLLVAPPGFRSKRRKSGANYKAGTLVFAGQSLDNLRTKRDESEEWWVATHQLGKPVLQCAVGSARYLGGAESLVDGLGRLDGGSVDAPVEEEHDEHGQEEGAERRVDDVAGIVGQLATPVGAVLAARQRRRAALGLTVVPADKRWEADQERQRPHHGQ